uniref:Uncharacterized protein n=1 Tax=Syphacia muris TaxID=451379 RepID=A0A0N5AI16_9BILA
MLVYGFSALYNFFFGFYFGVCLITDNYGPWEHNYHYQYSYPYPSGDRDDVGHTYIIISFFTYLVVTIILVLICFLLVKHRRILKTNPQLFVRSRIAPVQTTNNVTVIRQAAVTDVEVGRTGAQTNTSPSPLQASTFPIRSNTVLPTAPPLSGPITFVTPSLYPQNFTNGQSSSELDEWASCAANTQQAQPSLANTDTSAASTSALAHSLYDRFQDRNSILVPHYHSDAVNGDQMLQQNDVPTCLQVYYTPPPEYSEVVSNSNAYPAERQQSKNEL